MNSIIKEVRMNVDIISNNKEVGNIDITISNCTMFIIQVQKLDEILYIKDFTSMLLEEISKLKSQFKCKKIYFDLLHNSKGITKNDILNYITNQYY